MRLSGLQITRVSKQWWQIVSFLASLLTPLSSATTPHSARSKAPACTSDIFLLHPVIGGPGSAVGIAIGHGLDGRGSNPGGGKIFRTCPYRPWGPPSFLDKGYRVFPGGKKRPGREADPHPFLVPWSRKGRAIPLLPLSACTRVHFTFTFTSFYYTISPSQDYEYNLRSRT
jgi:hypothetical protein